MYTYVYKYKPYSDYFRFEYDVSNQCFESIDLAKANYEELKKEFLEIMNSDIHILCALVDLDNNEILYTEHVTRDDIYKVMAVLNENGFNSTAMLGKFFV